jgi:hypothetical protein
MKEGSVLAEEVSLHEDIPVLLKPAKFGLKT